jgi:hypothetical protein
MSVLELIMLVCFGAAWPFSIYKAYTSKDPEGQSLPFLFVILVGYLAGIGHKLLYSFDKVIYAYILNALMVAINIILVQRNRNLAVIETGSEETEVSVLINT